MGRARESLDELEGFQNQELGKVKHMLLSAETALERETQERKRLEQRVKETEEKAGDNSEVERLLLDAKRKDEEAELRLAKVREEGEARLAAVTKDMEEKVARLEERISNQDLSGDDRLQAVVKEVGAEHSSSGLCTYLRSLFQRESLENDLDRVRSDMTGLQNQLKEAEATLQKRDESLAAHDSELKTLRQERDALKTSLLEQEIVNHEHQNSKNTDKEKLKIECAKLATEKETLEMTLDRRDKELKAKKEEFRKELATHAEHKGELEKEAQSKSSRITALEAELLLLREKLSDEAKGRAESNGEVSSLKEALQEARQASEAKEQELVSYRDSLAKERETSAGSARAHSELEAKFVETTAEYEKTVMELADTSRARDELQKSCTEKGDAVNSLESKVSLLEATIKDKEDTFDSRVEATDVVQTLRKKLLEAEDDLADKKKVNNSSHSVHSSSSFIDSDFGPLFFPDH